AAPTMGVDLVLRFWNNLNPAATSPNPVNTGLNANTNPELRIVVPAPAAGWAAKIIYFRDIDLSTLAGGGILTTTDSFALETVYYQPGGTGTTYHPDMGEGFEGTGVEHGTSQDVFWEESTTAPNSVFFDATDSANFGGLPGNLANFAISMTADVSL